jgi:uncharacterized membrane protein
MLMATAMVSMLAGRAMAQSGYTYSLIPHDYVGSINNQGQMVGSDFTDISMDGFLLDKDVSTSMPDSPAWGINDRGQIVASAPSGSVLIDRGRVTPIVIPDSWFDYALGLNNHGQVCGLYFGFDFNMHAYVVDTNTGKVAVVDHPDAVFGTAALGINDHGQLVGYYVDADWNFVGFLYQDGVFTAITGPQGEYVYPAAINNLGEIAGDYFDADFNIHNFVLTRGVFTPIDVPGSAPGSVGVRGINDRGQVVGYALDADFNYVSFLATPSH